MKQLAIPLGEQTTLTKWLVISQQAGKCLVIPKGEGYGSSLREFHVKLQKTAAKSLVIPQAGERGAVSLRENYSYES